MTILEKLLPKALWESAYSCDECEYLLPKLSKEEYDEKKNALKLIRHKLAETPYRNGQYKMCDGWDIALLKDDGTFSDLDDDNNGALTALRRIACSFEKMRYSANNHTYTTKQQKAFLKAIVHYCDIEASRTDTGATRFTNSVFALPTCTANIYMAMLPDMEAVEEGISQDSLYQKTAELLLKCSLQCWTLPLRGDHTDSHPISFERMRRHLWWESGNCLGYRLLFYTAVMFLSPEMMEAVVATSIKAFSVTSHNTNDESFWKEGFTADGIGWAHGRQPAFQSYPGDGMRYTLFPLQHLRYSPWEKDIAKIDFDVAINYIRGSTWNQYKGHPAQPLTTRNMFSKDDGEKRPLLYIDIASNILMHFSDLLTKEQRNELRQLYSERYDLKMEGQPDGRYMGARFFFNNDILAKRSDSDYFMLHMASKRSDGAEFCHTFADCRNYYASDGAYLIMKNGDEYAKSKGAFKLSKMPGVTAREIENEKLLPGINWSGFHSVHDFCGGAVSGKYGASGFIFEKDKTKSVDAAGVLATDANPEVYDVIAYKGCFIFDKAIVCLGAGIKNLNTSLDGNITTSVNQTSRRGAIVYNNKDVDSVIKNQDECFIELEDDVFVSQDGISYYIYSEFTDGKVILSSKRERTNRHFLNASNPEGVDEDVDMFRLYINHGMAEEEKAYAYMMYTGDDTDGIKGCKPEIISNTKKLQAVRCNAMVGAVFYDETAILDTQRYTLSASAPAVMLIKEENDSLSIALSDPLQKEKCKMILTLYDKEKDTPKNITVTMPQGENSGRTTLVEMGT